MLLLSPLRRALPLLLVGFMAGCGDVRPRLTGTPWNGTGRFTQTRGGETKVVEIPVGLELTAEGDNVDALPALGLVGMWRVYGGNGGTGVSNDAPGPSQKAWASCAGEADGGANPIEITPLGSIASDNHYEWLYDAAFRFADLTTYELYDYQRADAPFARMSARESFEIVTVNAQETLSLRASSQGTLTRTDGTTEPIAITVEAALRRQPGFAAACRHQP